MKIPEFKKIKEKLEKLPRILAERAFRTFFGLFILSLLFGGILFYKYNVLAKKLKPEITEKPLQFQEKNYEDVLKFWAEKEERFKEADSKQYPNPFR